jgi:hypothetical protein
MTLLERNIYVQSTNLVTSNGYVRCRDVNVPLNCLVRCARPHNPNLSEKDLRQSDSTWMVKWYYTVIVGTEPGVYGDWYLLLGRLPIWAN